MDTHRAAHRERLTAPGLWWALVAVIALSVGWLLLVATSPAVAGAAIVVTAAVLGAGLWRYGSILVLAEPGELVAGEASLAHPHLGAVTPLGPAEWRAALDRAGPERAFLLTRPWIDRGVRVDVEDSADPTPYWLVSTRRPESVSRAVRQTGPAPAAGADDEGGTDGPQTGDERD